MENADLRVTSGFGHEWSTFKQGDAELDAAEHRQLFDEYFRLFPWFAIDRTNSAVVLHRINKRPRIVSRTAAFGSEPRGIALRLRRYGLHPTLQSA